MAIFGDENLGLLCPDRGRTGFLGVRFQQSVTAFGLDRSQNPRGSDEGEEAFVSKEEEEE